MCVNSDGGDLGQPGETAVAPTFDRKHLLNIRATPPTTTFTRSTLNRRNSSTGKTPTDGVLLSRKRSRFTPA